MNTFVPIRKILKSVSTHRVPNRERYTSLQECLDSPTENRRRQSKLRLWIILFLFLLAMVFVYAHRAYLFPEIYGQAFVNEIQFMPPAHDEEDYDIPQAYQQIITTTSTKTITTEHQQKDSLDTEIKKHIIMSTRMLPMCVLKKPYAKVSINETSVNLSSRNVHPLVKKGGYYRPSNCTAKHRVGIIVPYRNRLHNLGIFLFNIHPFLMQQKLEYQIFVIEQHGNEPFNKGRLFNAGFQEMIKFNTFHCVVLHDLDLLPLDENILYTCPTVPRHMCARVNDTESKKKFNVGYNYKSMFGGVVSMLVEQFERANGFSNLYFGWGAEDNDMFWRLRAAGYPIVRYNRSVGVYIVLPHKREPANPFRHHLLSRAVERYKIDGLSNVEYYVMSTKFLPLCTHIVVDINPRRDNITALNIKWGSTFYQF